LFQQGYFLLVPVITQVCRQCILLDAQHFAEAFYVVAFILLGDLNYRHVEINKKPMDRLGKLLVCESAGGNDIGLPYWSRKRYGIERFLV